MRAVRETILPVKAEALHEVEPADGQEAEQSQNAVLHADLKIEAVRLGYGSGVDPVVYLSDNIILRKYNGEGICSGSQQERVFQQRDRAGPEVAAAGCKSVVAGKNGRFRVICFTDLACVGKEAVAGVGGDEVDIRVDVRKVEISDQRIFLIP